MLGRDKDLIVPAFRDRRERKRYLTLKNFAMVCAAALLIFIGITIRSEMRGSGPTVYGRLTERRLPEVPKKGAMPVVRETPAVTDEATHADPTLIHAQARAQLLEAQRPPLEAAPIEVPRRTQASLAAGETDVAIVGGADGVAVVQRQRRKAQLSGGFGRN